MNSKNYFLLILLMLIGVSCRKGTTNMLTIINADGSCEVEFENDVQPSFMVADSTKVPTSPYFPVKTDSTWQLSWQKDDGEIHTNFPLKPTDPILINNDSAQNEFHVKIRKHFSSVYKMTELDTIKQLDNQKIKYDLKTQFRWFYTYYTYTETYPKLKFTKNTVPISKYMTDEEAKYWFNGSPDITKGMNGMEANDLSKDLEGKFNTWISNILWNEEYKVFVENYDKLSNPPVSQTQFVMLSDTIFEKKAQNLLEDGNFDVDKILDDYFHTKCYSDFAQKNDSLFNNKQDENLTDMSFVFDKVILNYSLQMPGKVLNGNFSSKDNKTLTWKVTSQRMFLQDYVIQAESRKANWWAFLITILIVFTTVGFRFIKKK